MSPKREIIFTEDAPAAVGPYSQAVRLGNFVFAAGQIPLVPGTGQLIEGGIDAQTRQVMQNLSSVLQAANRVISNKFRNSADTRL